MQDNTINDIVSRYSLPTLIKEHSIHARRFRNPLGTVSMEAFAIFY